MIEIVENSWRPFILLHDEEEGCEVFFDVTKRPLIIQYEDGTVLDLGDTSITVKESARDIIEAVNKMIKIEADKKAAQWEANMQQTAARVEANRAQFEDK